MTDLFRSCTHKRSPIVSRILHWGHTMELYQPSVLSNVGKNPKIAKYNSSPPRQIHHFLVQGPTCPEMVQIWCRRGYLTWSRPLAHCRHLTGQTPAGKEEEPAGQPERPRPPRPPRRPRSLAKTISPGQRCSPSRSDCGCPCPRLQ